MIIEAKVKTKQQTNSIIKMDDGTYKISVKALPDKNKANIEIIRILNEYFKIPQSQITIVSGRTTAIKRIKLGEGSR